VKGKVTLYGLLLAILMATRLMAQVTPIPEPDFLPMQATVTNTGPSSASLIIQKTYTLQQNEMRRVFGRVEITGNTGETSGTGSNTDYASADVECRGPNGSNTIVAIAEAGTNYLGPTTAAGPDYPTTGHLALYPLVLIQAPAAGTYVCELFAATGKPETAVGRAFQGDNTTWLRVSGPIATFNGLHEIERQSVRAPNAANSTNAANTPFSDAFTWGGPGCPGNGVGASCLYLGPGAQPSVDVFSPEARWSPATDAALWM